MRDLLLSTRDFVFFLRMSPQPLHIIASRLARAPIILFLLLSLMFPFSAGRDSFPCAGRGGGYDSRTASKLNWSFGLRRSDSNLRIPHYFRATMLRQERIESRSVTRFNEAARVYSLPLFWEKYCRHCIGRNHTLEIELDFFIVVRVTKHILAILTSQLIVFRTSSMFISLTTWQFCHVNIKQFCILINF